MAKTLPFKTAPKEEVYLVGNERVGELEFPVHGDLTVREQAYINEHLSKHSTFLEIARISNKIAKAEKIQPIAAHRFLTKCATAALNNQGDFDTKEENLRVKYAREIEGLIAFLLKIQWERQLITCAALVRHRLAGMEEFNPEDARELSQTLVTEIYGFSLLEVGAASAEDKTDSPEEMEAEIEENLGK